MMDNPFEAVAAQDDKGIQYKICDILKALDSDTVLIKSEACKIFKRVDTERFSPDIRVFYREVKADILKSQTDHANTKFGHFLDLAKETGKAAEQLQATLQKEALAAKGGGSGG